MISGTPAATDVVFFLRVGCDLSSQCQPLEQIAWGRASSFFLHQPNFVLEPFLPFWANDAFPALLQEHNVFLFFLPAAVAQPFLGTWSNGWTTSWRMREESALDCIFGGAG